MTKVWAHRGASGYFPENTMISFDNAVKFGVDGIELDVHLSKDDYIFVCHDEKVDRTTNGSGWIKEFSYKQLRKLDAGLWFNEKFKCQRLPLLREVLECYTNNNIKINIEIKAGSRFYPNIEEKVIDMIYHYGYNHKVILSSFDHLSVRKIKEIDDNIKTGILYEAALYKPIDYLKMVGADALHPYYLTIDEELIKESIRNNVDINTYTVNDVNIMDKLIKCNINAIITNYPDKAIEIVKKYK